MIELALVHTMLMLHLWLVSVARVVVDIIEVALVAAQWENVRMTQAACPQLVAQPLQSLAGVEMRW